MINKPIILIVDDLPINIDLLRDYLKKDYKLIVATRGDQAINLARTKKPDLILLDIMMPDINGYEICKILKEGKETHDIPIFFMTALDSDEDEEKGLSLGAVDYIKKPFRLHIVGGRIKTQIELKKHRDHLESIVKARTDELKHTRKEIIDRLSLASEYRDPETGNHIKRMSYYCEAIAFAYGLDEVLCELILHATPMHDVGKIGIPDSILLKPGKLTKEEFDTMKTHTTIGKNILSGNDSTGKKILPEANWELIKMAQIIAYTHHERWDGFGYPQGLKGEDIPLIGRITALADVFDALTSERPYKKAWPVEDAMEEINKQTGKQFDSKLCEIFNRILPEILEIKSEFSD